METREPTMVCKKRTNGDGCGDEGTCAVLFEAETFGEIGNRLARWMSDHPDHVPVSVSHAAETRREKRYDTVSWGREEPVTRYSAVLLVRPPRQAA